MQKKRIKLAKHSYHPVSFVLLVLLCFLFPSKIWSQENYEVRKIKFIGNNTLSTVILEEQMSLREVSWIDKKILKKEPSLFHATLLNNDLLRLERFYQREGFLNVRLSAHPPIIDDNKQTIKLTISIVEGKPVKVDSISFHFEKEPEEISADSLRMMLRQQSTKLPGSRFRDASLSIVMDELQTSINNLGYPFTKVDYEMGLDTLNHQLDLRFLIDPGSKSYFGSTTISGNQRISSEFIMGQSAYRTGMLYNQSRLEKTRIDLYQLQLFRIVSVLPDINQQHAGDSIPVRIYVEEAPRISSKFGLGYGTEDRFRAFVNFNYLGFLGNARRLNIYLKHSAIEPYLAQLRWIQPRLFGSKAGISLDPFASRNSEPGYDTRTWGINIPLNYKISPSWHSSLAYYFQNVKQFLEVGETLPSGLEGEELPYNKSGWLLSTVFNDTQPKFSPEKGFNIALGFKLNGYLFGGDFSYTRIWADYRSYHPLGNFTLALRTMAGIVNSGSNDAFVPVEDRFYSGGSNSVRGWGRSQLGPKRESGTPLGGNSIFEGNIEIRHPLFWQLSGVAFVDAGNVWHETFHFPLNELAFAAGGGLRLATPIGPVRVDLGFPLFATRKTPQLFISVGQAF